jgi:hypothetical protein
MRGSSAVLSVVMFLGMLLTLPGAARAQDQPPPEAAPPETASPAPAPPGPTDLELKAVGDRQVVLRFINGTEVVGRILTMDATTVVLRVSPSGQVTSFARAAVAQVILRETTRARVETDPGPPPPREPGPVGPAPERHVGLNLSIAPGFTLDVDYGLFHGFANVGIVLPLATDGGMVPFSIGLGVGIPLSPRHPALRLDIFAYMAMFADMTHEHYTGSTPSKYTLTYVGFGVGLGLHYTWRNGLTLGCSAPILGWSVRLGARSYDDSFGTSEATAYFYLASSVGLPLGFIGYRF